MALLNDLKKYVRTVLETLASVVANQANNWTKQAKAGVVPTTPATKAADLKTYLERVQPSRTAQDEAQGLVAKTYADARQSVLQEVADEVAWWEISSMLDANTCGPCRAIDGLRAAREEDLPPVPYAKCEGGKLCRCIHVAVLKSEEEARS